jgi:tRNA dimethylallyltransferase
MPKIKEAWGEGKLVIVVGGTGLYVQALTNGIETMKVPINQPLRDELSALSMTELQNKLMTLAPAKFASMNHSDQNNPRRLIRAIEIATFPNVASLQSTIHNPQPKLIGLKYFDTSKYRSAITTRVDARLTAGAIDETKRLLDSASPQSLSAIGYRSLAAHLRGELSYDAMHEQWIADELAYVKRQLTLFNKMGGVEWHEAGKTAMI